MATTTNYGWTTPDDTALVKDGASAIRTLGSSVDTTTKNLNPSTTLGDIEFRSSTSNVNTRLGIGTTGQVLNVAAGVPAWTTISSGGMTLISSGSIGASGIDLTSISASYEQLRLKLIDVNVSGGANLYHKLNNDGTSSYINSRITAYNATLSTEASGLGAQFQSNGEPLISGQTGAIEIMDFKNYSDTTGWKTIEALVCYIESASSRNTAAKTAGFWKNESAIDRITVTLSGGQTFTAGTYELWGMK